MRLVAVMLVVALAFGCRGTMEDEGAPPPEQERVPSNVRVVCDGEGAHVLTPEVEASPEGVHLAIDNRLQGNADLSVDHPGGGMGWSVPTGESERVADVPPGKVTIACYSRSWGREKALSIESGATEVLAGDSGYKSPGLDCPRGKLAGGMGPYSEEMGGEGDPVELLRSEVSGRLREGDVVEIAGNMRSRDEKTVRVVRDGKVVANAHYMRVSDGWLGA